MSDPPAPPLAPAAETVLQFLDSIGRRAEAELYLRLFRGCAPESFAVIASDARAIRDARGSFSEQLKFLRELGLVAPVVVGLFHPELAGPCAEELVRGLGALGVAAELVAPPEPGGLERWVELLRAGVVPIAALTSDAQPGARFAALGAVADGLASRKVVVVRTQGGLGPKGGSRLELPGGQWLARNGAGIAFVNLQRDLEALRRARFLHSDERTLLGYAEALLPEGTRRTVSVTSPMTVIRELFTERGSGTLLKRGSRILRHGSYATLDREALARVLEDAFGRRLLPGALDRPPLDVLVDERMQGAAVVEPSPVAPYLTKFAVVPLARGEGLGHDLWQELEAIHPRLTWRSRPENPILPWYAAQCQGMHREGRWQVFWRGLAPHEVEPAIRDCLERPVDLEPAPCSSP